MTLAFPPTPGNTVITGPVNNRQLEPNADGSLNIANSGVSPQMSNSDGVNPLNIILQALAAYVSGGPVLANGTPSQFAVDRIRTIEGKKTVTATITATTAGDANLACVAGALIKLTPGHKVQLSGGAVTEEVEVADTYVISTNATSIHLKSPVVNTGQTTAKFDTFDPKGPGGTAMTPDGLIPVVLVHEDISQRGNFFNFVSASFDGQSAAQYPEFVPGMFNGAGIDRQVGLNGFAATETNLDYWIRNGKAYSCSTGKVTAAASQAASFFIPNTNAKNIIIWSVRVMYSNASQLSDFRYITADDANIIAGTSDATNVLNLKGGGAASASGFAMHHVAAVTAPAVSAATLPLDEVLNAVNANAELLSPGMFIYVPPSTAGGIAAYTGTTATGSWSATVRWIEY